MKRRISITYNPESMSVYYILIGTTLSNIVYLYNNVVFSIGYAKMNRISGIMVRVLASSAVVPVFEPRSGQTKYYAISMCCFSAKHASLRRKSKDWLARYQDIVSEFCGLVLQWDNTLKIQISVLVYYKADLIFISLQINLFSPWYNRPLMIKQKRTITHSLCQNTICIPP